MKTRIISALVGTVILLAVLFCPWTWVFALAVAAAAAIAVWELLHNTGIVKNRVFLIGSMVFAALQVCVVYAERRLHQFAYLEEMPRFWLYLPDRLLWAVPAVYGLFVLLFFCLCRKAFVWKGMGLTVYATLGFCCLTAMRVYALLSLPYTLLAMVIPWMSDTGAYFVGTFLGKHKMAPVISPKKSWEGFFGGWLISIGLTAVYAVICNALMDPTYTFRFNVWGVVIVAAVLAPLSVLGDLFTSLIKRRCGIKDYGNIMPGHGGVMDRFDSVVAIAPLLYLLGRLSGVFEGLLWTKIL